jgi:hypothetical protein
MSDSFAYFRRFQNWGGMMKNIFAMFIIFLSPLTLFMTGIGADDPQPAAAFERAAMRADLFN